MSFIQDTYRIEDPKDVTITSLKKLVTSLNTQLGQMSVRLAALEAARPQAIDAGGYEITNAKGGLTAPSSVVVRRDLQERTLYRQQRISELQATERVRSARGVSRSTIGKLPDETITVAQLAEQEQRTGTVIRLTADVAFSGTAFADVTGLEFHVAENTDYTIEATILYTMVATNQGINLACNGPASPSYMNFSWNTNTTATATASRTFTAYDTSTAAATSVAGNNTARLHGTFRNGANPGTFILRAACDAAISNMTIYAGSTLVYKRTT